MSPSDSLSVAEVSERMGVTQPTLYTWRHQARIAGRAVPGDGRGPEAWRSMDKFGVVMETMGMVQAELAEYGRKKGLHVEQIAQWRKACMHAMAGDAHQANAKALAEEKRREEKAQADRASLQAACGVTGVGLRTHQRWSEGESVRTDGRPGARRPVPANKLSESQQREVLATCMQARFGDMQARQIVSILADEGAHLAGESTFYRLLHAQGAQQDRGRARRRYSKAPASHVARASHEVW